MAKRRRARRLSFLVGGLLALPGLALGLWEVYESGHLAIQTNGFRMSAFFAGFGFLFGWAAVRLVAWVADAPRGD